MRISDWSSDVCSSDLIWAQTGGKLHGFTCAVGTGGTLAGTGLGLKEHSPDITIALTDPYGAALYNYYAHGELRAEGSSVAEGIGQGRITANLEGAPEIGSASCRARVGQYV